MKILVVDDHVLIRSGLREVLMSLKRDAVVLETADCSRTLQFVAQHPDIELVLLDLTLPDGNGIELLAKIRKLRPAVGIVVLSAYDDRPNIERAFALGALGFIPKSSDGAVIASALQLIFSGGVYLPPELLTARTWPVPEPAKRSKHLSAEILALGLTERQLEVLSLVVQGHSNKAIGRLLNLAEPTVKNHVTAGLRALKAATRMEAMAVVSKQGLEFPMPQTVVNSRRSL